MNGRILDEDTPEGRIAAVVRSLCVQMEDRHNKTGLGPILPDYADFREALRPFLRMEILKARIDEARKTAGAVLTTRMRELSAELMDIKLPDGYDL